MKALRPFVLLRNVVSSQTCSDCKTPRIRNLSMPTSQAHQRWSFFAEDRQEESSVYKHALMFKQPSIIKYRQGIKNSVSLIGTVELPLKKVNTRDGSLGVHTLLKVKTFSQPRQYSKILLKMWGEIAEVAMNHLKPNDFIYVCGCLASYETTGKSGVLRIYNEVNVNEINYVAKTAEVLVQQRKTSDLQVSGEDDAEKYKERLHLWHVFFANPYEWTDFRKTKKNPGHPDFKNKSTGEVLWLNHDDPPWIIRQLKFLDSVSTGQSSEAHMNSTFCSFFSEDLFHRTDDSTWQNLGSY